MLVLRPRSTVSRQRRTIPVHASEGGRVVVGVTNARGKRVGAFSANTRKGAWQLRVPMGVIARLKFGQRYRVSVAAGCALGSGGLVLVRH